MVNVEDRIFQLLCNGRHDSKSHANYQGKFLDPFQKAEVARAVQNDPICTGTMIIRNMVNKYAG